jgi:hypothetical protein
MSAAAPITIKLSRSTSTWPQLSVALRPLGTIVWPFDSRVKVPLVQNVQPVLPGPDRLEDDDRRLA